MISRRVESVRIVYLVLAGAASPPGRALRNRQVELAGELLRALLEAGRRRPDRPWYVRAFNADAELHAHPLLTDAGQVHRKHLEGRWTEEFDLAACSSRLVLGLDRDEASFHRRQVGAVTSDVIFLSVDPPVDDAADLATYSDLLRMTRCGWIFLDPQVRRIPDALHGPHSVTIVDHPDVVAQILEYLAVAENTDGEPGTLLLPGEGPGRTIELDPAPAEPSAVVDVRPYR